ncbi:UNVERIFIED_CONTAM: hypothetical protein FKN15_019082 [Acipenser sinensis]
MYATLFVMVMSASFFNPSFAFSSHFDPDGAPLSELSWSSSLAVVAVSFSGLFTFIFLMLACLCCKKGDIGFKNSRKDGAPLSELSWSSSLAVVAVSFSGLFTFIFLMLACLCCKKGDIGFKEADRTEMGLLNVFLSLQEFENTEGEEYQAEFSTLTSSTSQAGPEVYILPLTEVSLPVSKQPGRSVQLLKSTDLGRHSLLYLKEIGNGWFGKVLLGEVNAGLSTTQVVVKELKASASVQDQMQFLEEVQPYRSLQHPHILQCLAQCSEVTPYLLVMEFCPLGDLKGYLRSCRAADSMTPDPLTLQRMACEIASGLLHLHKCNFVHCDLALRNCLLTAEVTVKIGDYGLSHNKYKDDYFVTVDQLWVPLRWIAPELIDEVHGNLLVVDQTKPSNICSGALGHSQYQDIYYAPGSGVTGSSCSGGLTLGVSPSYYDSKPSGLHTPGVVPVLSTHSPSVSNEYYIRIEEPSECNIDLDYTMCSYSPELDCSNGSFLGGGGDSGDCDNCPSEAQPNSYWLEEACKASAYDSDTSPAISLTMEPLLGQMSTASPVEPWESKQYYSYKVQEKEQGYYYDQSSLDGADHYLLEDSSENHRESWGSRSLRQALGELEDPLGVSPSLGGPQQLYRDPYIEGSRPALSKRSAGECYYDMTRSLRKSMPGSNTVCVDMEEEDSGLFIGRRDSDLEAVDVFAEKEALAQANHWTSNSSANNNSLSFGKRSRNNIHDGYADFHFTMPSAGLEESWRAFKAKENLTYPAPQAFPYLEAATLIEGGGIPLTNEHKLFPSSECNSYIYPCHEGEERMSPPEGHSSYQEHGFVDPLLGSVVRSYALNDYIKQKQTVGLKKENGESSPSTTLGGTVASNVVCPVLPVSTSHSTELELGGLNEKNPYRDSAYFSDYDAENERYSWDEGDEFPEKLDDDIIVPGPEKEGPVADPASLNVEEEDPQQQKQQQENHVEDEDQLQNDYSGRQIDEQKQGQDIEDGGEILTTPEVLETEFATVHSTLTPSSPTPPELEDEGLELEPELCRDEQYSEICTASVPEESAQPEHPGIPDQVQGPGSLEGPLVEASDSAKGGGASKNKTETNDCREEGDGGESAEGTSSTGLPNLDDSPQQPHSNCPDVESRRKEDPGEASECQMERVSPADGEEADEEDGDSEDSEESDEELRCYNIQEQSEESEEEFPAVPIVVSDSSEARNLRSLLKMPSLLSQSFCEELDRKKKAVSFFDDVTVYLFDQESPTRELADHSFPQGAESSGRSSETGETRPQERVSTSDDSSDGNVSEESGGFEWDDDFPLTPVTSSPMSSLGPDPMDPPAAPESKQGPTVQYSRFTVSPSSVSRFSITHVSDSDVDSVGGEHCTLELRRLVRNRRLQYYSRSIEAWLFRLTSKPLVICHDVCYAVPTFPCSHSASTVPFHCKP